MASRRARLGQLGRSALVWLVVLLALTQLVLGLGLYRCHPEMVEPDHTMRLARLEARLREGAGRPLVLVLGSSRAANGVRPSAIGDVSGDSSRRAPVVFNFATLGCGPVREWLTLRRILASGVRPDWLLVEACPLFWPQIGYYCEENLLLRTYVYAPDLPVLASLYDKGWPALGRVCQETATPIVHHRLYLLDRYAPFLLPRSDRGDLVLGRAGWQGLDANGWLPAPPRRADWADYVAHQRNVAQPILDAFGVDGHTDGALRGLLQECKTHGIRTAFFVTPESSVLRSWYPPAARAIFHDHLAGLGREYEVPIFDAREWIEDEGFHDFCHLAPAGANAFSARLGRDVVRVLVQGGGRRKEARSSSDVPGDLR